ncbi:hypothetical protein HAX54_000937 [Datura stramonium]|uniref:Uncharacterized protein n=1 Tax=Datura stramonium TaxID=4076 RepID=A0ABS8T2H5_DATST|nr:hypothetical protein [Datura stramonium]
MAHSCARQQYTGARPCGADSNSAQARGAGFPRRWQVRNNPSPVRRRVQTTPVLEDKGMRHGKGMRRRARGLKFLALTARAARLRFINLTMNYWEYDTKRHVILRDTPKWSFLVKLGAKNLKGLRMKLLVACATIGASADVALGVGDESLVNVVESVDGEGGDETYSSSEMEEFEVGDGDGELDLGDADLGDWVGAFSLLLLLGAAPGDDARTFCR